MTCIPSGQRSRLSGPVTSATQAPSRTRPSPSYADVHAETGTFPIAACMSSVIVMPIE